MTAKVTTDQKVYLIVDKKSHKRTKVWGKQVRVYLRKGHALNSCNKDTHMVVEFVLKDGEVVSE